MVIIVRWNHKLTGVFHFCPNVAGCTLIGQEKHRQVIDRQLSVVEGLACGVVRCGEYRFHVKGGHIQWIFFLLPPSCHLPFQSLILVFFVSVLGSLLLFQQLMGRPFFSKYTLQSRHWTFFGRWKDRLYSLLKMSLYRLQETGVTPVVSHSST